MRIYLAADIEGCAGYVSHEEGKQGTYLYPYFQKEMSKEVSAVCRGALKGGAEDILVHDAHGCARNLEPSLLPKEVKLMRLSGGDPYAMLSGIQEEKYDAVFMTGFHVGAGSDESPVSHTFNHNTAEIFLNGERLSEFLFNAYSASSLGIPVPFVSGDEGICKFAKSLIPGITTVEAVKGYGLGSISPHPDVVCEELEKAAKEALSGDWRSCTPPLPASFEITIRFHKTGDAYFNSFYPGISQTDAYTLKYTADEWFDVLTMIHFVLDK